MARMATLLLDGAGRDQATVGGLPFVRMEVTEVEASKAQVAALMGVSQVVWPNGSRTVWGSPSKVPAGVTAKPVRDFLVFGEVEEVEKHLHLILNPPPPPPRKPNPVVPPKVATRKKATTKKTAKKKASPKK